MAPATVLVVDDDPVILKLLEVNFEMEGFTVVRAADGAEGLERARAVLPDIVILDVMMPRMTGYEVAKALREDERTADIPIIFVTARAQSSDVERGMELGVDDYVTKPFDPLDLIARVNVLLGQRADAQSTVEAEADGDPTGIPGEGVVVEGVPEEGVVAEGAPEGNGSGPGASPVGPPPASEAPTVPGDTDRGDRSPL
jgi:DNA-binding response OmpR family regulator